MKKLIVLLFIASSIYGVRFSPSNCKTNKPVPRQRHVPIEWNTDAVCLGNSFVPNQGNWYFSPWLHAYFQSPEWWIYHCDKGWLFPESDGNQGVWFFWQRVDSWVWTRSDVYPLAFDTRSRQWFNFCVKPSTRGYTN